MTYRAKILMAPSKKDVGSVLACPIVESCRQAMDSGQTGFTIALSGGSLPAFLQALPAAFEKAGVDPQWTKWHVLLADERCVDVTSPDSNLGAIRNNFSSRVPIPPGQVYGIDESLLTYGSGPVAKSYEEKVVVPLLQKSGGKLDCVVLGFGPDGHTCSLFPGHSLLGETEKLVAPIDDSPKPPSSRITLTYPVLNKMSRQVIFCGAGAGKAPILRAVFDAAVCVDDPVEGIVDGAAAFDVVMNDPAPYPCGMARTEKGGSSLTWVIDAAAAAEGLRIGGPKTYRAKVLMAPSKKTVGDVLASPVVACCKSALASRGAFTIALSGGSLPGFLQVLPQAFKRAGIDPQWEKWHVLLADERCVVEGDKDSNLGAIRKNFTDLVPVPRGQVYGIDENLLSKSSAAMAASYETNVLKPLLDKSGNMLDCVVLGFGPDGHTCSLFPGHPLLGETEKLVAPIDDSPKPPSSRITLTYPVLNEMSRQVIFCGAGAGKAPILRAVFGMSSLVADTIEDEVLGAQAFYSQMNDPAPYPCGMVRTVDGEGTLVWVIDADAAAEGISIVPS